LIDTTIVPQQTEITQFIFGQPLIAETAELPDADYGFLVAGFLHPAEQIGNWCYSGGPEVRDHWSGLVR
jgi:hypothetical protein